MRIGPVEIFDVELAVTIGGDSGEIVTITAAAALGASIGPISASVDGLGLIASLTSGPDPLLRIGELGIDIGFKPPKGVGIGVDLDVVSGGGYLYIDAEAGSYAGVLELEVMGDRHLGGGDRRHQASRTSTGGRCSSPCSSTFRRSSSGSGSR